MPEANDIDLVRDFARDHSEPAFTELVRRHVNLVYSIARRCTDSDSDAQDVTQAVFVILARKAAGLRARTVLTGWLYETTRYTAACMQRTNARRHVREQEAYMQSALNEADTADAWARLAPHLETAMSQLAERDRTLLALRFYENKSGPEAAALLGIQEAAAHKRTARALEKLRKFFIRRGVALSTAAVAGAVSANSVKAAPVALVKIISAGAMAKGAAAGISTLTLVDGTLKIMAWAKAKVVIAVSASVLLLAGTATLVQQESTGKPPPEPIFQGKTLREWIKAEPPLRVISANDTVEYRRNALVAMGHPAIQYLRWMVLHPHASFLKFGEFADPSGARVNYMNAVCAAMFIGTNAAEIAPALVRLWESNDQPTYSFYNGFPMALAALGNRSPVVITALHRHFHSRVFPMNAALCALAAWQLNPNDAEAASLVRQSLTPVSDFLIASGPVRPTPRLNKQTATAGAGLTASVLLDRLAELGPLANPFMPEMRKLIANSVSASSDVRARAALAAWHLFHTSDQASQTIRKLGTAVVRPTATATEVNDFASAALELIEIPEARQAAMPLLKELKNYPDKSAAEFCSNILIRLESAEP